jgi:hypothetical protein
MAVQIEGPEYSQQHTPVKRFYTSRHCDFQLLALRDAFIAAAQDYKFAAKRSGIPAVAGVPSGMRLEFGVARSPVT